ncbi:GNAT family N-acetyltransferase [Segnochrobactraceae bacterium EtOH-i3]
MPPEALSEDDEDECLTTRRLVLRRPHPAHADAVTVLADNRRVAINLASLPHPYRRADALAWIEAAREQDPRAASFVICRRNPAGPEDIIGACGFGLLPEKDDIEVGYWIGEPFWGQGFATEAAQAVIDHAFACHGLAEIWASCRVTNSGSRRVIEKCGFQARGMGMCRSRAVGGMVPVERFRLDRGAWTALNAWSGGGEP